MWREISSTQVHPSLNSYPHYPTAQPNHNANSKWSITGQRSSYSLPHPGHAQSHMRWQKQEPPPSRHLSNSTRNLSAAHNHIPNPSFVHPMVHDGRPHYQTNTGGGRPRPASMYDTPSMPSLPIMSYHHQQQQHQNGFMPPPSAGRKGGNNQPPPRNGSVGLRQSPGELVREIFFVGCICRIWKTYGAKMVGIDSI